MMKSRSLILLLAGILLITVQSCTGRKSNTQSQTEMEKEYPVTLMTLEPGHFHAALVQKSMYEEVNPVAYVYAPRGPELENFLAFIESFNSRPDHPTAWKEVVYDRPDYFMKMLLERPGNVVVLSGNNARKTEYILRSIEAGLNVYADKPMVITPGAYPLLVSAFDTARSRGLLLYDIMTERFEITALLQRELAALPWLFGTLDPGTPDDPSLVQESVHRFYKKVAGRPLIRPAWSFDVSQQGEGIVDVSTHLVDLILWGAFPGQAVSRDQVEVLRGRHWTTDLTPTQFRTVTGLDSWPAFLLPYVEDTLLRVMANGEILFRVRDIHARTRVEWTYHTPAASDTHYSLMRGTLCELIISQKEQENYHPVLYVKALTSPARTEEALQRAMNEVIRPRYPGVGVEEVKEGLWKLVIPGKYDVGHEAHFRQVTENYLDYLLHGTMPAWEVPNILTKYWITTRALELARGEE